MREIGAFVISTFHLLETFLSTLYTCVSRPPRSGAAGEAPLSFPYIIWAEQKQKRERTLGDREREEEEEEDNGKDFC